MSSFLVNKCGVHTTDSYDWIQAADRAFEQGSSAWVISVMGDLDPSQQESDPDDPGEDH